MTVGADQWMRRALDEVRAAKTLKATGMGQQAYFHAGQAVEFALKAIYLRRKVLKELPSTCKGAEWHDLKLVANHAGLHHDISILRTTDKKKYLNWLTVKDWESNARFPNMKVSRKDLADLFLAVCNERDGIMVWLESVFQRS